MLVQYKAEQISGEGIVSWDKGAHCVIPEVQICGKVVQDGTPTPDAPIMPVFSEGTTVECSGSIAVAPRLLAVSDAYCDTWNPQTGKGIRRIHKYKLPAIGWVPYSYNNGAYYKYKTVSPDGYLPIGSPAKNQYLCSHLPGVGYDRLNNYENNGILCAKRNESAGDIIAKVAMGTVDEWLQFLTENEVYVWYALEEPYAFETAPQFLIQPHGAGNIIQIGGTVDNCPIIARPVTHR